MTDLNSESHFFDYFIKSANTDVSFAKEFKNHCPCFFFYGRIFMNDGNEILYYFTLSQIKFDESAPYSLGRIVYDPGRNQSLKAKRRTHV